ncbi:TrkH family potassium uptake protein [Alistipes sp.]|uniref:TrkH family potassium uptake protein n=1 Tax=Alistipes sp. TaxID=1872444 RepID=UPI003AEF9598
MRKACERLLRWAGYVHRHFGHWLLKFDVERFFTFGYIASTPQRQLTMGYLSYFLIGGLLLCLPFMTVGKVSFVDNLFTSMSAVSTTGLSTVDVAAEYTFWGELLILLLIQLGGIGYMTLSTFVMYRVTHHFVGVRAQAFRKQFSLPENFRVAGMAASILRYTLVFEVAGALLLYLFFRIEGVDRPLWSAVFHSVSAFCTAGFSIYPDNLMRFADNVPVNLVIMTLSYAGAMGFIVISDLWHKITHRTHRVTFTSKVILTITLIVTLWGTFHLYFFEPSFDAYSPGERLLVSLFQTMSAMTTVGYNTVDVGDLIPLSLFVLTVVMYVGASPSGTGGGVKSTTLSAVFAFIKARLGLRREVTLVGRRIPDYRVEDALTIFVFYTVILFFGTYLLTMTEAGRSAFLPLMFEAASALGTVGLSSGVSATLTAPGKLILIALMFVGRVGVVTVGNVMLMRLAREQNRGKEDDLAV